MKKKQAETITINRSLPRKTRELTNPLNICREVQDTLDEVRRGDIDEKRAIATYQGLKEASGGLRLARDFLRTAINAGMKVSPEQLAPMLGEGVQLKDGDHKPPRK